MNKRPNSCCPPKDGFPPREIVVVREVSGSRNDHRGLKRISEAGAEDRDAVRETAKAYLLQIHRCPGPTTYVDIHGGETVTDDRAGLLATFRQIADDRPLDLVDSRKTVRNKSTVILPA